jgi:molybdate transport system ATP-binding protein
MLLLDEPLSALDGPTREALRGELRNLLSSLSIPVLLVTHDRVGALALGDQVAIVNERRIVQHASIEEVFRRPLTRPIAPNKKPDGSDDPEGRQKNRRVEITVQKQ